MLNFDSNGCLKPYDLIEINLAEFVENFVYNEHRQILYNEYQQFLKNLSELGINNHTQWIDGSFVTKKIFPNDIDIICMIDFEFYEKHNSSFQKLKQVFKKLDVYFVRNYPIEHPKSNLTEMDKLDWFHLFSKDRKRNKKGIIQIEIQL